MATVAELREQADALGVRYTTKTRKPELEVLISGHLAETAIKPVESDSEAVSAEGAPTLPIKADKALMARMAGAMGKSALPMSNEHRSRVYGSQRYGLPLRLILDAPALSLMTPRQARRIRKAENRADARNTRACASMGC